MTGLYDEEEKEWRHSSVPVRGEEGSGLTEDEVTERGVTAGGVTEGGWLFSMRLGGRCGESMSLAELAFFEWEGEEEVDMVCSGESDVTLDSLW